ncbi:MAG: proline--tRNA ligase [Thermoplasmata archaeon]|nr:proline--tRNA ligase [Thermoplasmata archaeon]
MEHKKEVDVSEWYNEVVEAAGLCDKRYPVKGMNIWLPYGWKIMQLIDKKIRKEFDATGHSEVCFPLLIPENEFQKEAEHIKGFSAQVFWVTHAGDNPLDIKLVLRPTSETAMYSMFSIWIRSHADLPLKIYQIVNVFRYETKQTRAFIRVREIHFFEAHTCHADAEGSEGQIKEDIQIMENLGKALALPYILHKRPDWDKFAGAVYSLGADLLAGEKALQIGTIHQYHENFAKAYNILFEDKDGTHRHAHQTTFGLSERLVGAVVGVHGDNSGLILPPEIAPYQVVIVPVPKKEKKEVVEGYAMEIQKLLMDAGIRVHLDLRDLRPGNKYYDWELKGVPLRIEVGERESAGGTVTAVRRDTREKITIAREGLADVVKSLLTKVQADLYERAAKALEANIHWITSIEEGRNRRGILRFNWCGSEDCGMGIEKGLDVSILGIPLNVNARSGRCIVCGKPTEMIADAGRSL